MEHLIGELSERVTRIGLSRVARETALSRSTVHRILTGKVEPTIGSLRELALACGLDLSITLAPLSDPDAAIAARLLLDATMPDGLATDGTRAWEGRLERIAGDDPVEITHSAGRASNVLNRNGAVLLRGDSAAMRLASAGDAAQSRWALSGAAAFALDGDDISGPSILWTERPGDARRMLTDTYTEVAAPSNATVIVAPANPSIFVDSFSVGAIRYVAPMQMLLDSFGLGGALEARALAVAREWSS